MRFGLALAVVALTAGLVVGCGQSEVSQQDQSQKMEALHKAEQANRAKDGVKSE